MEKLMVIGFGVTLAAAQQFTVGDDQFPLTNADQWQLLFILVASALTSLSNEASKQGEGQPFRTLRFFGNVGLCIAAGVAVPLFAAWMAEVLFKVHVDWRANIGLSIVGAYIGRDALVALYSGLKSAGELAAKLKGLKVSFDPQKGGKDAPGTQGPSPGEDGEQHEL